MKKILIIFSFALTLMVKSGMAQVNININLGAQPSWGPAGYDYVDYYYLPDIETYYYVPKRQFIYLDNGQWIFSPTVPARYRGYNLFNGYKVVLNTPTPYKYFKDHRVKYAGYKGYNGKQLTLKNSGKGQYKRIEKRPTAKSNAGKNVSTNKGKDSGNEKGNGKGKGKGAGKH